MQKLSGDGGSRSRFLSLFEKHNNLDHEIARLEGSDGRGYNLEVVRLKKQKLQLKDDMLKILQKESVDAG
ncbi:YdcH family protein [Citrobacter amalonaticus]|uniref:YdcH family protein n=1 Tax=Citrobacter amalonaticus TaxID=35703 RepID=UPI001E2E559C|nr:YdcH family protein [Citrobacter amalonaticus]